MADDNDVVLSDGHSTLGKNSTHFPGYMYYLGVFLYNTPNDLTENYLHHYFRYTESYESVATSCPVDGMVLAPFVCVLSTAGVVIDT